MTKINEKNISDIIKEDFENPNPTIDCSLENTKTRNIFSIMTDKIEYYSLSIIILLGLCLSTYEIVSYHENLKEIFDNPPKKEELSNIELDKLLYMNHMNQSYTK